MKFIFYSLLSLEKMRIEKKIFILNPNKLGGTNGTATMGGGSGSGGSQVMSMLSKTTTSSRHLLPTIPMQSTFKSLLTIPISNVQATATTTTPMAHNGTSNFMSSKLNYSSSGLGNSNGNTKVYFKPQDLQQHATTRTNVQTETYLIQKNPHNNADSRGSTTTVNVGGGGIIRSNGLTNKVERPTSTLTRRVFINTSSATTSPRLEPPTPSPRQHSQPTASPRVVHSSTVASGNLQREKDHHNDYERSRSIMIDFADRDKSPLGKSQQQQQVTKNCVTTTTTLHTTKTTSSSSVVNVRSQSPNLNNSSENLLATKNDRKLKSWASGSRLDGGKDNLLIEATTPTSTPAAKSTNNNVNLTDWKTTASVNQNEKQQQQLLLESKDEDTVTTAPNEATVPKSGKLIDAVAAAASLNSIDDGLGMVEKMNNKNNRQSANKSPSSYLKEKNDQQLNHLNKKLASSNGNIYLNGNNNNNNSNKSKEHLLDTSRLTSSSSIDFTTLDQSDRTHEKQKKRTTKEREPSQMFTRANQRNNNNVIRPKSSLNNAMYNFRSSSITTESTSNNHVTTPRVNGSYHNHHHQNTAATRAASNNKEAMGDRPPGRLNYYDSDTNTFSEGNVVGGNSNVMMRRAHSENVRKKRGTFFMFKMRML
jgi:hypothetical protein